MIERKQYNVDTDPFDALAYMQASRRVNLSGSDVVIIDEVGFERCVKTLHNALYTRTPKDTQ
jgi:nucleoside-triphosphatase THEP1